MTATPTAETLPFRWYSDPEQLRRRAGADLRLAPGSTSAAPPRPPSRARFFTAACGDVPVLVVRDRDGELRGFVNVCRHRGAVLLEGCGTRQTIQCHYHAWTYELDGSLRAAPRSEREADFDPTSLSLVPVAVDTWGPFVFVNPDAGAAPLARHARRRCRSCSRATSTWTRSSSTRARTRRSPRTGRSSSRTSSSATTARPRTPASARSSTSIPTATRSSRIRPSPRSSARPRAGGESGQFHLIWPNTAINVFPGPPNLSIGPIAPDGPERTTRFLDYFFAPGRRPGLDRRVLRLRRPGRTRGRRPRRVGPARHALGPRRARTAAARERAADRGVPELGADEDRLAL